MTLFAVQGAAGCGKTVRLITEVEQSLAMAPLLEGQRVLALTFMHGARRRLHQKLTAVASVRGRLHCVTIDSFAQHLTMRWRALANALGAATLRPEEYDACCDLAALLLEQPDVARWVAASFPVILVDEAQDLRPQRLRMVVALATAARLFVAADEFQCLDQNLRPNPAVDWLNRACRPITLARVHRTSVNALLAAAVALRSGKAPIPDGDFKILCAKGAPMAATYLCNAIAWRKGGAAAIITPATRGGFAQSLITIVGQRPLGKQQNGPYKIAWEMSEDEEVDRLLDGFPMEGPLDFPETLAALDQLKDGPIARAVGARVRRQARVAGTLMFDPHEIVQLVRRQVAVRRQHRRGDDPNLAAMTVQQAKNREFEGVIVLWPYQVGGDAEHKRRLLYNAVTRARRWCTVIVQGDGILAEPPFQP